MSELVTLTIDDAEVSVPPGTLIVEAANQIEREIPVFCYHSKMDPVGMCRMCLVTVGTPGRDRATGKAELDEDGNPIIRFFPKPMDCLYNACIAWNGGYYPKRRVFGRPDSGFRISLNQPSPRLSNL